jgi:murein DD-endopeptidase MepM/ murein hydrolase activator NlpD
MRIPFDSNTVRVTSPYGERTLNGAKQFHGGYDLVGVGSYDICAVVGGKVVHSRIISDKSNPTWQWGNYVCVKGTDGRLYYYCHMKSRAVSAGQTVKAGDLLGIMGNTGYSFGAHLHFGLMINGSWVNPVNYLTCYTPGGKAITATD